MTGGTPMTLTPLRERTAWKALERHYDEIARQDPQPFKQYLASVADAWVRHRRARPRS